jgi:hypothetical protein
MPRGSHRTRLTAAVIGASAVVIAGCSSDRHANADPDGLFPQVYSERGFMDRGSTLFRATAATATTKSYSFDVTLPERQAFALVANCTSGEISAQGATGRCQDGVGGVLGFCAGGHFHISASVTEDQRRKWGVAVYRTPPCDSTPDPRKESPTPTG